MSRLRRILLVGGGIVLALLLVVVITLAVLLRPAALKARIEREVHEATGLALHIDGGVEWHAWPEPRITLGAARLGEAAPAVAAGPPILQWRILAAAARWSPLLHGEAKLETLTLDGVALTLARDADGTLHWPKIEPAPAEGGEHGATEPARPISIGHLEVKNAVVRITGEGGGASLDGLTFQGGVNYDPASGTLRLAQPAAAAVAHGGTLQGEGLRVVLDAANLTVAPAPLHFETRLVHAWLGKLEAAVRFDGPVNLGEGPLTGAGELTVATASLRAFTAALGVELPPTRDPSVFGPFEFTTTWRADAAGIDMDPLVVKLDRNAFKGSASVPAGGPAAGHPARFALKGDTLDLRRYLRPKDKPGEPFTLPVEWLRAQHVEGVLELKEAHAIVGVLHGVKIKVLDQPAGKGAGKRAGKGAGKAAPHRAK